MSRDLLRFALTELWTYEYLSTQTDVKRFALTELWTCQYSSIQNDLKRFAKICTDRTLNIPIFAYSKWWDLLRFALTERWTYQYFPFKVLTGDYADRTLNLSIDLRWWDFEDPTSAPRKNKIHIDNSKQIKNYRSENNESNVNFKQWCAISSPGVDISVPKLMIEFVIMSLSTGILSQNCAVSLDAKWGLCITL